MKKIFLFVGVVSITLLSCNKEVTSPALNTAEPTSISTVSRPVTDFSISFDGKGSYTTNDANYLNSFTELKNAVETIAGTNKSFTITVNENGYIASNNKYYNGMEFMNAMTTYGNFYFAGTEELSVVFGKEGFKSISNPELFNRFPDMEASLIANGDMMKDQIQDGKDVTILVSKNNQISVNGVAVNTQTEDRREYNECRTWNWWLGESLSAIACSYLLLNL